MNPEDRRYILRHRFSSDVMYEADVLTARMTSRICLEMLSVEECDRWMQCCQAAVDCCVNIGAQNQTDAPGKDKIKILHFKQIANRITASARPYH